MAGSPTDPSALFREMLGQWEAMANEFGGNLMKSGEFTRVMHTANAANMKMKEARTDLMERALDAANMPTKGEVADLSARLNRIEATVDRIESMLAAQAGVPTIPERPKPKRTRKPPCAQGDRVSDGTRTVELPGIVEQARVEFDRALKRNIKGLGYFVSSAPVLGASPKDRLIQRGTMNLYHYRPMSDEVYRVPLLLVMATTNRGYIFDMVPGQSLVEYLLRAGYDVFMLDWEAPRADEKHLGIADYVLDFLPTAIERVQQETGEEDFTIVGYCFGGALSVLWAGLHPDAPMKNLVCFTTPVDFSKMEMFQAWSDRRFFNVDQLVDTFGNCPADYLYTAFDMLRPGARMVANFRLYDNMWNDEFVKSFRMFDRWAADMLPLAGEYFRETTKQLMWNNELYDGTMTVAGRTVDLSAITAPFLHVTAQHDHIVPPAASAPLIEMIGSADKEAVEMKGGHVSLVAGGNAIKRLWPKLTDWLSERST